MITNSFGSSKTIFRFENNSGTDQSINQSIMYFRIISLHIIARSQLADYRNKPGTNIGKPVFMDDPGNLLQVENRISFVIKYYNNIQYFNNMYNISVVNRKFSSFF